MKDKHKNIGLAAGAGAVLVAGAIAVSHPKDAREANGYRVERQSDNNFTAYQIKNGKKVLIGKDLNSDQADMLLNQKLGRHKKE